MAAHRAYREEQYEKLIDAVYERRGWTNNGVPTLETLRALGIDLSRRGRGGGEASGVMRENVIRENVMRDGFTQ